MGYRCKWMDFPVTICCIVQMHSPFTIELSQKVIQIFDLYTELHGTRISFFGPDKKLIYPDSIGRPNCTHCRMLREELKLDSRCRELDQQMMNTALEQRGMISYICHAGLYEATAPVFADGQLAGYVMIGQFQSEINQATSPYREQWQQEKQNDALQVAFENTPRFPEEKIKPLLAMLQHLLELIIETHLIRHKDNDLIQPVIDQLRKNPTQPLSLEDAAARCGRSVSTVSRLFRKITGQSFKQYQLHVRLQLACEQLTLHPLRPVAQIAAETGFDDPYYFSRLFKQQMHCSPTEYRQTHT
ncbi:MAG: AraC family transcriptional regulator [Kiritimatiellaceae bacterium]|nr:AraC family transcriptional regulator [Kiritimatiellaceae bacterium]